MPYPPDQLLTLLLKEVSRSFYLTLRILPGKVRPQIALAYLLARTTDTIADTELVPVERRLKALQSLREQLTANHPGPLDLGDLASHQGSAPERALLENCAASVALLHRLTPADRKLVVDVLATIAGGQELDLLRFDPTHNQSIIALKTDQELDDYTYRVAGCVGEFWTRICRANLFPKARLDDLSLLANGVLFGKGLQLVNILRDLANDLHKGRCYVPEEKLAAVGLAPKDLVDPSNEPRFRPLYNYYLDRAAACLLAGWDYTGSLPRSCVRVRLACAWPILIGLETVRLLRTQNVLAARQPIKVPRRNVRRLILRSLLLYPFPGAWEKLAPLSQ